MAVEHAQVEVSVSPSDSRAIARLAVYQAKAGDDAGAMRSARQALALAPNDQQVLVRAGVVNALARRTAASLELLERAVANGYSKRLIEEDEDFAILDPRRDLRRWSQTQLR